MPAYSRLTGLNVHAIDFDQSLESITVSSHETNPLARLPAVALRTAQQPTRPPITGVAFARFYTTDPAAAQKFYGSTLGFERKEADDMWLYPVNHSQWIEVLTTPAPPHPNVRMAAVGFTTEDAAKLERYLEGHNIKPEVPLKNGQFGVRDPEGNLVIFVQRNSEKLVATALAAPSAASTRIIHVGFVVTDRAKEDAFWQQILGFKPYWHGGPKTMASTTGSASRFPTAPTGSNTCSTPAPIPVFTRPA